MLFEVAFDHFGREKFCYLLFYYALMLPGKGQREETHSGRHNYKAIEGPGEGKFYVLDSFVGVERGHQEVVKTSFMPVSIALLNIHGLVDKTSFASRLEDFYLYDEIPLTFSSEPSTH